MFHVSEHEEVHIEQLKLIQIEKDKMMIKTFHWANPYAYAWSDRKNLEEDHNKQSQILHRILPHWLCNTVGQCVYYSRYI